ncbi:sigma-70 family RNA polymerase sigma factor [Nocardia sp. NPDC051832]|uniref:sigma-70 family RNA polymerase sigma factor n=1 Tax=Nocardia sp. NPDC051832 TaxID=3155673 RepID=UPI0034240490
MFHTAGEELDRAVAAAAQGDRWALAQVLELIRPLVVRYCRARIGVARGRISADDVAQEVCLAVLTALPRYQDQGRPFMAFVYGIASHKVADAHRYAAHTKAEAVSEPPETLLPVPAGAEQRALEPEAHRRLNQLLATLPEKHQEVLILRLAMGLSAEETAVAVGSTAGAIRVAQHRALAKLKADVERTGELRGNG